MSIQALRAFTDRERTLAHRLLAARVAYMMGRKLEEGDWAEVYCGAKGIPFRGWSNVEVDVIYDSVGLELKMLGKGSSQPITSLCGTQLMHPAATRAIRIESIDRDANEVMRDVFHQYAAVIERRRATVARASGVERPEMRTGLLLWQTSLRQFLYFEELLVAPSPDEFRAVWNTRAAAGPRLGSKNLWIYERATNRKRFSVTTQAGIKIQPYFDVPAQDDPNLYVFTVQGEEVADGVVRVWLTRATARELERVVGSLDAETVSSAILSSPPPAVGASAAAESEAVAEVYVKSEAYDSLLDKFDAKSDELRFRALLSTLEADV
jgi:hypothetical protein